jgi:hypothetical protein
LTFSVPDFLKKSSGSLPIPKSAVVAEAKPILYVDGQQCQEQGYTQDNDNYYVWCATHFSTRELAVTFTSPAKNGSEPTIFYTATIAKLLLLVIVHR